MRTCPEKDRTRTSKTKAPKVAKAGNVLPSAPAASHEASSLALLRGDLVDEDPASENIIVIGQTISLAMFLGNIRESQLIT